MLDDDDITKIADAVVARLQFAAPEDPLFTRTESARYLKVGQRTFDRFREDHPKALEPWAVEHPLRWARSTLDMFRLGGGATLNHRRGRRSANESGDKTTGLFKRVAVDSHLRSASSGNSASPCV